MKRVLVVDDSEPLGRMLSQTLSRAGHEAAWVPSGAAALEHAPSAALDVAFVDMQLADMHGSELLAELRTAGPGCRVIGLSGAAPDPDVVRAFDAFLLKPVALDTLLAAVTTQ
jgi:DNA-binding response OmpR family regulator